MSASVVVIKVGGHALSAAASLDAAIDSLATDIRQLQLDGHDVVVVHGAGPQITELLSELGIASSFVDGIRVTDAASMDVVAMVLSLINLRIVALLISHGVAASGLSGVDQQMVRAGELDVRYGLVAKTLDVTPSALHELLRVGVVPVISPVALHQNGQIVNANADFVAGALASALNADALVLLSDVDQLRLDADDESTALSRVTRSELEELMASGAVRDGMRPKMTAALSALSAGARRVVLANGARANASSGALRGNGLFTEVTE